MHKIYLFIICHLLFTTVFGFELKTLYQKHNALPKTEREKVLVRHTKKSLEKALRLESKLSRKSFQKIVGVQSWRESFIIPVHNLPLKDIGVIPEFHLLNNLCSLPKASHLHVGLLAGDSFIASLYGNQSSLDQQIGLDWFRECSKEVFDKNCKAFLNPNKYQIINDECLNFDKSVFSKPIDIYFYDADHSLRAQEKAFTYYNDLLAKVFIVLIDDWNAPWIRYATFKAFDKLDYTILYESIFPLQANQQKMQYLAVIRKAKTNSVETSQVDFNSNNALLDHNKQVVFKAIERSWCSNEKANLIMDIVFKTKPEICVEIGVFTGSSFLPMVSALSVCGKGHAYAVDSWSNEEAVQGLPPSEHYSWWSSVDMGKAYNTFIEMLSDPALSSYFTILNTTSALASHQLDRIDFIHMDGSFSEEGALRDFELYFPKVKAGGYILLSNTFFSINQQYFKTKALCALIENCEVIAEIDNNNTILFRKL